jgi:hypothetical protein
MEKAPLDAAPLFVVPDWGTVAAYFAESFNRDLAKFSGRYVDKMDGYLDRNSAEQKVFWEFSGPGRPVSDTKMVRPSGFEPPTFCSGGTRSMCMLFIPQQVHAGCERGLRGVQRLLCTLLCTPFVFT